MSGKIIYSLLFFILISGCSKKNPDLAPADFSTNKIAGKWKIVPSSSNEYLIFSLEKAYLANDSGKIDLEINPDSLGIKLMDGGRLAGYFVFTEKNRSKWKGIWDDNLVELWLDH